MLCCSICGTFKERNCYSNNQLSKRTRRRCKECVKQKKYKTYKPAQTKNKKTEEFKNNENDLSLHALLISGFICNSTLKSIHGITSIIKGYYLSFYIKKLETFLLEYIEQNGPSYTKLEWSIYKTFMLYQINNYNKCYDKINKCYIINDKYDNYEIKVLKMFQTWCACFKPLFSGRPTSFRPYQMSDRYIEMGQLFFTKSILKVSNLDIKLISKYDLRLNMVGKLRNCKYDMIAKLFPNYDTIMLLDDVFDDEFIINVYRFIQKQIDDVQLQRIRIYSPVYKGMNKGLDREQVITKFKKIYDKKFENYGWKIYEDAYFEKIGYRTVH